MNQKKNICKHSNCKAAQESDAGLLGANQVLRNAVRVRGVRCHGKKHYEGVQFNVIGVMRVRVDVKFPGILLPNT